ncbi:UNVERIFIED_CONTAM: histone lysine acetyltransferase HAT1 [Hammondia hammondi]|eukprot:XP_008884721.1 histone lysine acetyltransferase HAT1 [Hammondia hammondi]
MPREASSGVSPRPLSPPSPAGHGDSVSPQGATLPSLNALQVVRFHPVFADSDFFSPPEHLAFSPLFCHHFFKESETVSGFDELSIDIFFAPDTFDTFIRVQGVISPKARDPAAVHAALMRDLFDSVRFPGNLSTSAEEFLANIRRNRSHFSPPGRVVAERLLHAEKQEEARKEEKQEGAKKEEKKEKQEEAKKEKQEEAKKEEKKEKQEEAKKEKKAPQETAVQGEETEVEEVVKLQLRECSFDVEEGHPFLLLHRRVEWFLHWFIESASAIHTDSQWRVILPYLVTERRPKQAAARIHREGEKRQAPRENRRPKRAEESAAADSPETEPSSDLVVDLAQKARERCAEVAHAFEERWKRSSEAGDGGLAASKENGEARRERRPSASEGHCDKKPRTEAVASREEGFSVLPVFAVYGQPEAELAHSAEEREARDGEGDATPRADSEIQRGETRTPKKERTEDRGTARYHLAGIATTYTFYAVTGFRRRISQFMVFPHVQRQGVGMTILEHVYCDAILDPCVIEFTVEDPASSFSQLRDVASLKLLVDLGVLPSALLYPPASSEETPEEADRRRCLSSPQRLMLLVKETTTQATRMSEILQLGQQLPHPLPPPPVDSEDLEHRRDWRRPIHSVSQGSSSSSFSSSSSSSSSAFPSSAASPGSRAGEDDCCRDIRVKVKRRLKRENLHWLVDIPLAQQKAELQQLWNQLYVKYYR